MAENLLVVESPAKAKTINRYLGKAFAVRACMGHVKDLPKTGLGVDVEADFEPRYEVLPGRAKVLRGLKAEARKAQKVYLATDWDREGEAIGWHLAGELKTAGNEVLRVRFREITETAVRAAMAAPTALDMDLVGAQQARRVVDRIVGYSLSPLLWKAVRRGLSAGRVQSVAVRLLCEREEAIEAFRPAEYWDLSVELGAAAGAFTARLADLGGRDAQKLDAGPAAALGGELAELEYTVASVARREERRHPFPPFTTSTLQQEAARKLGFTAVRTMRAAQQLYEGVDLGAEGPTGLITYMRTDSVRVSPQAQAEARALVAGLFGADHLPPAAPRYRTRRPGQDAHEAVRPASCLRRPDALASRLAPDQHRLYGLIWRRFVASQMAPALFDAVAVEVLAPRPRPAPGSPPGDALFKASGAVRRFAGFQAALEWGVPRRAPGRAAGEEAGAEGPQGPEGAERGDRPLPALAAGERLAFLGGAPAQHFTEPPPRYGDASLIKALEELGVGRPSTYAPTLATLLDRQYAERLRAGGGRLKPTELGRLVNGVLVRHFNGVMDVGFTARMEESLDQVEEGTLPWRKAVAAFYGPFSAELKAARAALKGQAAQAAPTDVACDRCGAPMAVKWGRLGKFLACTAYPQCRNTRALAASKDGVVRAAARATAGETCALCGKPMQVKAGRFGEFLSCSDYPGCRGARPLPGSEGILCPRCGQGHVGRRKSKKGRAFYGCDRYPACDFVSRDKPVAGTCPRCGATHLVERGGRDGLKWRCAAKGCGHREDPGALPAPASAATRGAA